MRYVTLILYPDVEAFHPIEQQLTEDPSITRKAIHDVKGLDDGTIALLAEVEGDLHRYHQIMSDSPSVRTFAASGNDSGYVYSQVEPTPLTQQLLAWQQEQAFVVKMPIKYTEDGGQRVTMVGNEEDLPDAESIPDEIDMELVSTESYHPEAEGVFADLTDRQREVLEMSLRLGYYENPRGVTHEEIAADGDLGHWNIRSPTASLLT